MKQWVVDEEKREILFVVLSGLSLVVSFFQLFGKNVPVDPSWIAIALCGVPIVKGAVEGLVTEFDMKADVLVAIALVAAVCIGETFAAGEVAFIMVIGAMLEDRTVAKARAGIEKLVQLTPRTARVMQADGEHIVAAEEVQVGDVLRVLAGETIAVDGVITSGQTSVNQAVMTGESLPVDKGAGDEVASGTVNQYGTFDMRATRVGEDSSLQRMIRLVESADASKAKIVGIADRWATWIVVIALTSAFVTWLVTGELIRSVTILVVFCPCALVLATPTAIMAGIGNAAKHGILVREGDALERLAKISRIAFDKTGTLTYGKPSVAAVETVGADLAPDRLLELVASAERRSEHPLGMAIVSHYRLVTGTYPDEPERFNMLPGRGVKAEVNGDSILAGNAELLDEHAVIMPPELAARGEQFRDQGATLIYIAVNGKASGFIALMDTLRSEAVEVVGQIKQIGVKSILLTGDNPAAAAYIAEKAGISDIHASCLPEDKLAVIERYQSKNQLICMVGDGVNDAPALKKAHVGVAMGGVGSDIAVDAADMALVGDEIKALPHLLRLARRTMNTIKLNLTLSMALNFAAIILAMTGVLNPVVGALVHNIGSVAVIINSALLANYSRG